MLPLGDLFAKRYADLDVVVRVLLRAGGSASALGLSGARSGESRPHGGPHPVPFHPAVQGAQLLDVRVEVEVAVVSLHGGRFSAGRLAQHLGAWLIEVVLRRHWGPTVLPAGLPGCCIPRAAAGRAAGLCCGAAAPCASCRAAAAAPRPIAGVASSPRPSDVLVYRDHQSTEVKHVRHDVRDFLFSAVRGLLFRSYYYLLV